MGFLITVIIVLAALFVIYLLLYTQLLKVVKANNKAYDQLESDLTSELHSVQKRLDIEIHCAEQQSKTHSRLVRVLKEQIVSDKALIEKYETVTNEKHKQERPTVKLNNFCITIKSKKHNKEVYNWLKENYEIPAAISPHERPICYVVSDGFVVVLFSKNWYSAYRDVTLNYAREYNKSIQTK